MVWGLEALGYTVSFWAGVMDVLVWVLCGDIYIGACGLWVWGVVLVFP